jgi:hypothetical protein
MITNDDIITATVCQGNDDPGPIIEIAAEIAGLRVNPSGCAAPADWEIADLFGNDGTLHLCDHHLGIRGGKAVVEQHGWDVRRITRTHADNINTKADRAVTAALHLIRQPSLADVTTGNDADDLELLLHWLFDNPDDITAVFLWLALGIQAAIDQGTRDAVVYNTSRPAIRRGLELAVIVLRHTDTINDKDRS